MAKRLLKKFGGSSISDANKMQHAAQLVANALKQGDAIIVVLSAMGDTTNQLLEQAARQNLNAKQQAALLATGEQQSVDHFVQCLKKLGVNAKSFNARQVPIHATQNFSDARITDINSDALERCLAQNIVPVVTGFQGVNKNADTVTLGRGGSDLSAVALAATLKVAECQIYTDMDGIHNADPRLTRNTKRIDQLCYEQAIALSNAGAKILQARALELAGKYHVPMRVLSTFEDSVGTSIVYAMPDRQLPYVIALVSKQVASDMAELSFIGFGLRDVSDKISNIFTQHGVAANVQQLSDFTSCWQFSRQRDNKLLDVFLSSLF